MAPAVLGRTLHSHEYRELPHKATPDKPPPVAAMLILFTNTRAMVTAMTAAMDALCAKTHAMVTAIIAAMATLSVKTHAMVSAMIVAIADLRV